MPGIASTIAALETSAVREILKLTQGPGVLSLAGGLPAPEAFDLEGLRQAFERALTGPGARRHLQYSLTEGDPDLREALAALSRARGLDAAADRVIVTTGSQQALDLVSTALLEPGDAVVVEEPCYLAALQLFRLRGLRVVPVRTDESGLDPDAAEAAIRHHGAKLVYTVPNFQNPTGVTLALDRRERLTAVAAASDVWVLEDDPYGELRYSGEPLPPVAAVGATNVIYASSLSKVVAPGLRIGWVLAPAEVCAAVAKVKQCRDLHTSTIDQRSAYEYLSAGRLPSHLEGVRCRYGDGLRAMLGQLAGTMPAGTCWTRPEGGMFVWLTLPDPIDAEALLPACVAQGVAYVPGAAFFADRRRSSTARLSFVTLEPATLVQALGRLGDVLSRNRPDARGV